MNRLAVCVDVGSTWTKLTVVDLDAGSLAASTAHPTTVDTDVLAGVDAALADAADRLPGADLSQVYCCSSAGGGLRLAVVGYEALVSAEAANRVATSAGARVVHVAAGRLTPAGVRAVRADRPDVVLLVGGTDGGEGDVLRHNAVRLATARLRIPVVVAGNTDARAEAVAVLTNGGVPVTGTDNVLPRIGVLRPAPARAAIREVFLRHVIGGKGLSKGPRFGRLVRAATPDAVLTGVEVLADEIGRDLLVVDVGGATTDVYSALVPDGGAPVDVAGALWRARTVEGDLGVRWSAPGTVAAGAAERLLCPAEAGRLAAVAQRLAGPGTGSGPDGGSGDGLAHGSADGLAHGSADGLLLARLAVTVALRRHARGADRGRDLRDVDLVIASGGVFRHAAEDTALGAVGAALTDHGGGWAVPRHPRVIVDVGSVLAPAGLLADEHPEAAIALLRRHFVPSVTH